jgi:HEPN domain-containing protein
MLNIPANIDTPSIICDRIKGIIFIKGISIPENSMGFYDNIIKWVSNNVDTSLAQFEVNIQLEYFNTSSLKSLLNLIKKAIEKNNEQFRVRVKWHYDEDDEDMRYRGEELSLILKYPFEYIINT